MNISGFVKRHPLIAFFAITFAFSWTIEFFIPQISNTAVLGPFLTAVVLSAILAPERVNSFRPRRWALFALVFGVAFAAWVIFTPLLTAQFAQQPWYALWFPGAVSSAVIAFLISGPMVSRRGVRDLLGHVAKWRVGWSSYAAALLLGPALWLLPVGLDLALGGQFPPWPRGAPTLGLILATFAWVLLFGGGLEEPGWRGFALPRLQSRWNPIVASVILGFFWALWHVPEYVTGFYNATSNTGPAALAGIMFRFVWVIPLAIIFTWLYNRSGRSVFILILLHTSFDTATAIVPLSFRAGALMLGTMWAIALIVIVSGQMWRKLQSDEPIALAPAMALGN